MSELVTLRNKIMNIAVTILTAGLIGAFTWAWNLNAANAVMEERVDAIELEIKEAAFDEEKDHEIIKDFSSIITRVESIERQLVELWKNLNQAQDKEILWERRLTRQEAKIDYCCD